MKSNAKEDVNISGRKLESNIKKTVNNAEEQIHEDSGCLRLLQKIENKDKKMIIDEMRDLGRLYKLIDYGMVNRLLDNEVAISVIGLQVLRDLK
ncbi:MAG: hypothetical protein WBE68_14605 [Candidatus Nitrosopolaris sp.]